MAVSRFPTDSRYAALYGGDVTGPIFLFFQQLPDEYPGNIIKQMTIGVTRGADSTSRIRRWVLHTRGTRAQMAQLDAHYAEAKSQLLPFEFRMWRSGLADTGTLYTAVHYESYEYPAHGQIDNQERHITLVKEGLA